MNQRGSCPADEVRLDRAVFVGKSDYAAHAITY
jgi:hypothetical protein